MTARHIVHEPRAPIDFTPVPRDPRGARSDGWTPDRQRDFIGVLAATGSVRTACRAVGLQVCGVYRLRKLPGAESFRAAWDAAVLRGTAAISAVLIDHSINGVPEAVFYRGKQVGVRRRFNHRTMIWVMERGGQWRNYGLDAFGQCTCPAAQRERDQRQQVTQTMVQLAEDLGISL
jgi:hypothetical protein